MVDAKRHTRTKKKNHPLISRLPMAPIWIPMHVPTGFGLAKGLTTSSPAAIHFQPGAFFGVGIQDHWLQGLTKDQGEANLQHLHTAQGPMFDQ